jgi:iron complex outermembrane recepter protein
VADATDTSPSRKSSDDLENLSLEQLINVKVTSVSKKETEAFASPAAITVITQDDIQRNGFTSIPEALRMVPGMDVAQITASQWAVGARGFNAEYAGSLLVLVDGRTVYTAAFSGVFWELQDIVMEDLDRIEVIRGPGAALWGDNAVNGVINIVTKSASKTQGGFITTSFGTENQSITSLRYGGELGTNLFYRVYLKYESQEGFLNSMGNRMPDGWDTLHGGARMDWEPNPNDRFTLQGDYLDGNFGGTSQLPQLTPPYSSNFSGVNPKSAGNIMGRWTHDFSSGSELTLQMYYDHTGYIDAGNQLRENVYDVDLQYHFALGESQDILCGTGFRDSEDDVSPTFAVTFNPQKSYTQIYNVFAQDDVTLIKDRLHLILGVKLDHNSFTQFEIQPDARLLWTPSSQQTAWMAVSRAVVTPSIGDIGSVYNASVIPTSHGPALVSLYGDPDLKAEQLLSYQLGYRFAPAPRWSFDLAAYYNVYHDLSIYQTGTPFFEATPVPHLVIPETLGEIQEGDTYGAELSAQWKPLDDWRLMASYSWLHMQMRPDNLTDGNSPQNQFQIRSYLDLTHNIDFSSTLYYVDRLPDQMVPSYFGLDLGLRWQINRSWEIGVFGQNLLNTGTVEFGNYRTPLRTEIPRSVYGKITWRF